MYDINDRKYDTLDVANGKESRDVLKLIDIVDTMQSYFSHHDLYEIDRRHLEFWLSDILTAFEPLQDSWIKWQANDYDNCLMLLER